MADPQNQAAPGKGVQTEPTSYSIHRGSAPAPQRTAQVDPSGEVSVGRPRESPPGTPMGPVAGSAPNAPASASGPIPRYDVQPRAAHPDFQQSPPPEQPQAASEISSLREENASLQSALRELKETQKRELEELRLRMDLSRPPMAPQQIPFAQLAPGADANAPVTNRQLAEFAQVVMPQIAGTAQAQAIRASWNVTPQEEAAILTEYPTLQQTPEPARTNFILRAHKLRSPTQNGTTTPAGEQHSAAPAPQRPQQYTVPAVEHGQQAHVVPDAPPRHPAEVARAEYDRAEAMPARTPQEARARKQAMRQAWDNYQRAIGMSEDLQKSTGFKQTL